MAFMKRSDALKQLPGYNPTWGEFDDELSEDLASQLRAVRARYGPAVFPLTTKLLRSALGKDITVIWGQTWISLNTREEQLHEVETVHVSNDDGLICFNGYAVLCSEDDLMLEDLEDLQVNTGSGQDPVFVFLKSTAVPRVPEELL